MTGAGMRLTVLNRLAPGRVERLPVSPTPGLIRIALRKSAAAMRLDGVGLTPGCPAILERQLLCPGRGRLIAARAVAARRLIVGDGAILGMGRRGAPE